MSAGRARGYFENFKEGKEDWKVIYYMCISKEMKDDTREARNETVRRELIKDGERERERGVKRYLGVTRGHKERK